MKPIEDAGAVAKVTKPLLPRVYESHKLPCAIQCAGAIITVNNRHDSGSLCAMQSDGSRWRRLKFADEDGAVAQQDITSLVRSAVEGMLPALVPSVPPVKVIEHAPQGQLPSSAELAELRESIRVLANANLEISDHLQTVLRENADLMARLEFVERHALAKAEIKAA